jgi:hypothetical protein
VESKLNDWEGYLPQPLSKTTKFSVAPILSYLLNH